jgi:hypothetical protein
MIVHYLIMSILVLVPSLLIIYIIGAARKNLRQDRVSLMFQVRQIFQEQKVAVSEFYHTSEWDDRFRNAGLSKFTPFVYRVSRDILFAIMLFTLHIHFFTTDGSKYPFAGIMLLIMIYALTLLREKFPIMYLLNYFRKGYDRKKNTDVFMLQQLISNEYNSANQSQQNIYNLFVYLHRYMKHIRQPMNNFLDEYRSDPMSEIPFINFGARIGTDEAKELAKLLHQIDKSNDVHDILNKRYEELKSRRMQNYKASMKDRETFGHLLTFSGVLVAVCAAFCTYILEHQDQMRNIGNFH